MLHCDGTAAHYLVDTVDTTSAHKWASSWMGGYMTAQMVDVKKHSTANDRRTTEIMEEFGLVAVCRIELAQLSGRRREPWMNGDGWHNLIPAPSGLCCLIEGVVSQTAMLVCFFQ